MTLSDYILLGGMTFLAYVVKGLTGFGNTVVMSPMYAYIVSPKVTTPVYLIFSLPTNAMQFYKNRHHVRIKVLLPVILLMLVGTLPGAFLLKYVDAALLKVFLGLFIVGISADLFHHKYMKHQKLQPHRFMKIGFSLFAGLTVGMFGISLPIAAYLTRSSENPEAFKGQLSIVFIIDNVLRGLLYVALGIFTAQILKLALVMLPVVFAGMGFGMWLSHKMRTEWIDKLIIVLLAFMGLNLCITNLLTKMG